MSTLKQLAKEFWLPFLIAAIWTAFNYQSSLQERNLAGVVKTFSASFFLISWATGQFVRVSRQARTEKGLATVEARTIELTKNLDDAANRLTSTITGGDSFAHLSMSQVGPDAFSPYVIHSGDHPLANVVARICDLNAFKQNIAAGKPFASDINLNIGDLAPNLAESLGINLKISSPNQDWNVFYSARNWLWTQCIRGRIVDGEWMFASILTRQEGAVAKTLLVSVPNAFPKIGEALFDDAERDPPLAAQS